LEDEIDFIMPQSPSVQHDSSFLKTQRLIHKQQQSIYRQNAANAASALLKQHNGCTNNQNDESKNFLIKNELSEIMSRLNIISSSSSSSSSTVSSLSSSSSSSSNESDTNELQNVVDIIQANDFQNKPGLKFLTKLSSDLPCSPTKFAAYAFLKNTKPINDSKSPK
jgi:hypothetical protein